MARQLAVVSFVLMIAGLTPVVVAKDAPAEDAARWIVALDVPPGVERGGTWNGLPVLRSVPQAGFLVVEASAKTADGLRLLDAVRFVEPDGLLQMAYTPNDPQYPDQPAPGVINADTFWDASVGTDERSLCVIDTGVRHTHEDLTGARYLGGTDIADDDPDPSDPHGHGTHVTGIAAATMDNALGIAGLAQAPFRVAKILESASGRMYISDLAAALYWCADMGADVINMSVGTYLDFDIVEEAVRYAHDAGVLMFAASGNDGYSTVMYPARYADVVAVGCVVNTATCWFSNGGPQLELAAHGYDVPSTCAQHDAHYCNASGTSMSSPTAAGAALLLWSTFPRLTRDEVRTVLQETAWDRGAAGWDKWYGHGIVDIQAAMDALVPDLGYEQTLFEDFDDGSADGWALDGIWHISDLCGPGSSPPDYLGFHFVDRCSYDPTEYLDFGTCCDEADHTFGAASIPLDLSGLKSAEVRFDHRWETESASVSRDVMRVQVRVDGDGDWATLDRWDARDPNQLAWGAHAVSLDDHVGKTVRLRFHFDTIDGQNQHHEGWHIDDFSLWTTDNLPPWADAGPDLSYRDSDGNGSEAFRFNGSRSADIFDGGDIVSWDWYLGDTLLGSGETMVAYLPRGAHNVTLVVTDDGGATASDQTHVDVLPPLPPVADAGPDQFHRDADADGNETVLLDGDGTDPDGRIVSYEWTLNGTYLASNPVPFVDLPVGTNNVTLTVTDDAGLTAQDHVLIVIGPNYPPYAHAGPDQDLSDPDGDGLVTFPLDGAASYDEDGHLVEHAWYVDTTLVANGSRPNVTFPVGTHTLRLQVTDNGNATGNDTVSLLARPNEAPVADAGPNHTVPDGDEDGLGRVRLDGTASADDGTNLTFTWSQAGTVVATGPTPTVDLPIGTHDLTLQVTDVVGATATDTVRVDVVPNAPPGAAFTFSCLTRDCTFDAFPATDDEGIVSYAWDFGDGNNTTTTAAVTTHTYGENGRYTACLEVVDAAGRNDTTCITKRVLGVAAYLDFESVHETIVREGGQWHRTDMCGQAHTGQHYMGYHRTDICDFRGGATKGEFIVRANLSGAADPVLQFSHRIDTPWWIPKSVWVGWDHPFAGAGWTRIAQYGSPSAAPDWTTVTLTLTDEHLAWGDGDEVMIRFYVDDAHSQSHAYAGWHLDTIQIGDRSELIVPNRPPVAEAGPDVSVTDDDGDGDQTVTLDGTASSDLDGSISSYQWTIGANNVSTDAIAQVPLPHGTYTATLTVTDDDGESHQDTTTVQVLPNGPPLAEAGPDLQVSDHDGDGQHDVPLDGTASADADGTLAAYEWYHDGTLIATGATANAALPLGLLNVTLRVTDNGGATDTDMVAVEVLPNAGPLADAGPDRETRDLDGDGAEPVILDGTGSSDPDGDLVAYEWLLNGTVVATGALTNVSLLPGGHDVTLRVVDDGGRDATDTFHVDVLPNRAPVADAGTDLEARDADGTGDEPVALDGTGSSDPDGGALTYEWSLGGTPIATGATPNVDLAVGTHEVTLTVTDPAGRTSQDRIIVDVLPNRAPVASAGADRSAHDADGDGNETVPLDGRASYDPDGPVDLTWTLDGHVVATGATPDVAIPVGTHDVVLMVHDSGGQNATDTVQVTVHPNTPPIAVAPLDASRNDDDRDGVEPFTFDGTDSSDPHGAIVAYEWTENGTLLATGATPMVSLPVGVHPIDLTVRDAAGATDTASFLVEVTQNRAPTARFAVSCSDVLCTFDAGDSSDPDGDPLLVTWAFGDGRNGDGAATTHAYPHAGRYVACLTVDDGFGGTDHTCRSLQLFDVQVEETFDEGSAQGWSLGGLWRVDDTCVTPPTAPYYLGYHQGLICNYQTASRTVGAAEFPLDLTAATTAELRFQTRWEVESTSGSIARDFMRVQVSPVDEPGIYTLTSWDSRTGNRYGWSTETLDLSGFAGQAVRVRFHFDSANDQNNHYSGWQIDNVRVISDGIRPNEPPVAAFTTTCDEGQCTFDASGSTDDRYVVDWAWDFGDGNTARGETVAHSYTASGTYQVRLVATDNRGATDQHVEPVTVDVPTLEPPVADFSHTCHGNDCTFDGSPSSDPDGTVVSWSWDFGDGTNGTGVGPSHTYATAGTYNVTLVVTDDDGLTAERTQSVNVGIPAPPVASFTGTCDAKTCTFDGRASSDPDGTVVAWSWDFGDGTNASGATTSHTYAAAGTYNVTLTVTDDEGQTDQETKSLQVDDETPVRPGPDAPPSDPQVPDQQTDLMGDRVPVPWMDIESAWFEDDARHLYVGLKLADIPPDDASLSYVAYRVWFTPQWAPTDPSYGARVPPGETVERFEARAHLNPAGPDAAPNVRYELWAHTQDTTTFMAHERKIADISGSHSADTAILWWPIERATLAAPSEATLTEPSGMASPAVRDTITLYGSSGDGTGVGRDHTF